jgi:hypothetical protein
MLVSSCFCTLCLSVGENVLEVVWLSTAVCTMTTTITCTATRCSLQGQFNLIHTLHTFAVHEKNYSLLQTWQRSLYWYRAVIRCAELCSVHLLVQEQQVVALKSNHVQTSNLHCADRSFSLSLFWLMRTQWWCVHNVNTPYACAHYLNTLHLVHVYARYYCYFFMYCCRCWSGV